jgi:triosephosphate isomerase
MLVIGNWKANGSYNLCESFIRNFQSNGNVVICPPAIYLCNMVGKIPGVEIGAQDCSSYGSGPYTGDISCELLKDIGIKYAIIGHSERIRFHQETIDITINN